MFLFIVSCVSVTVYVSVDICQFLLHLYVYGYMYVKNYISSFVGILEASFKLSKGTCSDVIELGGLVSFVRSYRSKGTNSTFVYTIH